MHPLAARLRRALRAPRTIVAEVGAIAIACAVATIVPQDPSGAERARLDLASPRLARVVEALALDHVLTSTWFLALVGAAAASLALVVLEQWSRVTAEWPAIPGEASFASAPLRAEFERAARGGATRIERGSRAGLLGSPLFHLGLLVVVLAGLARMLFAAEAVLTLYEGEPRSAFPAIDGHSEGLLATPVAFDASLELLDVRPVRHPSGTLAALSARLALGAPRREEVLAVNAPLELADLRLYLTTRLGCAALVEVEWRGRTWRRAAMLAEERDGEFASAEALPGLELRLRAAEGRGGERPSELEVRAVRDGTLVAIASLRPGEQARLPEDGRVTLRGLRYTARLAAARDLSVWPAYAGFVLALAGAVLLFAVVKVDAAVIVVPDGDRERVTVALRPQRFAPIYRPELERRVREEGGTPPDRGGTAG